MKTLWKPNSSTNTLFCTGTLFYKIQAPLHFSSRKNHPQEHARTGFCIHYTAIINTRSRYYIQLLHTATLHFHWPHWPPTPPHCNWSHRFHRWTLTRLPRQPAVSSDLIPNRMKDGISKRESLQGVFCEGQVCFHSTLVKNIWDLKNPTQHFGKKTPLLFTTHLGDFPEPAIDGPFHMRSGKHCSWSSSNPPQKNSVGKHRKSWARNKETWIIQNDSKMCSYRLNYICSRFAVRYHPTPPPHMVWSQNLRVAAFRMKTLHLQCFLHGGLLARSANLQIPWIFATNLPKTCYLQCFGFDIVE